MKEAPEPNNAAAHPNSERILEWFEGVLPNDGRWRHTSVPEIRQRPDGHALIVAYRPEGIILKRVCEPILPWLGEETRPSAEPWRSTEWRPGGAFGQLGRPWRAAIGELSVGRVSRVRQELS